MAYIPVQNQSVSGTVGASVVGLPPVNLNVGGNPVTTANPVAVQPPASGSLPVLNIGSIISVNQGSIGAVIIGGSIASAGVANQSVSGTVQAELLSTNASIITVGGVTGNSSVQVLNFPVNTSVSGAVSISNFPTTQNISGSVAAWLQSTNASVITVGSPVANQSVSGAVSVSNFPTTQNVSGSVVAFQGTTEWTVKSSISGGIFPVSGSVAATITNTNVNVSGSVVAFGFPTNQNVSGSVVAFQGGTQITSLVSTVPSSVIVGASIFGTVPVTQVTSPWLTVPTSGSVSATISNTNVNVSGSVAAYNVSTNASFISLPQANTSSVYAVLSSITTISVMAANLSRKAGTIYNAAGTPVFIKLGTAATTSVYTVALNPTDYYELPGGWTGVVAGITTSNAGIINVTELT